MSIALFAISTLTFLSSLAVMAGAKSSIHEIYGACLFIATAIFFSGGCVVVAVNRLRRTVERGAPSAGVAPAPTPWEAPARQPSPTRFAGSPDLPPT